MGRTTANAACVSCGTAHPGVSVGLGICPACARTDAGARAALRSHSLVRESFGLPGEPPRTEGGEPCDVCAQACVIGEGERGFCGLRTVRDGELVHLGGTPERGVLGWYRDPLPTNCVAGGVCGGRHRSGRHNLAVYYRACSLDCLFCQNWSFRETDLAHSKGHSAEDVVDLARWNTHCVCFFGGDPAPQMPHALAAAETLVERDITVCWETAGASTPDLLDRAFDLSFRSGGCVKVDLKAFTEPLHVVLTGASNRTTLANLERLGKRFGARPDPPALVVSTLLVPGYVHAEEVGRIASFLAGIDTAIPYSLLAFAPQFRVNDLPTTSANHAEEAERAARDAGLQEVRIANRHLLRPGD